MAAPRTWATGWILFGLLAGCAREAAPEDEIARGAAPRDQVATAGAQEHAGGGAKEPVALDGTSNDRVAPDGAPHVHLALEGAPGDGAAPDGAPGDHVAPDGASNDRVAPDGAPGAVAARGGEPVTLRLGARRERSVEGKPEHLLACDLDGDGALDLVAATFAPGALLIWRGSAPADSTPEVVPIGDYPLQPVALASASASGAPVRLAVASRADRKLVLLDLTRPGAPSTVRTIDLSDVPRVIAAGDLGLDGTLDVAVATDEGHLVIVAESGATTRRTLSANLPRCALVLADGSGLAIGYQDAQAVDVYRATQLAVLEEQPARRLALSGIPRDLCQADLDGDGDPELAIAVGEDAVLVYGLGAGGGTAAAIEPDPPVPQVLATGSIPLALDAFDADHKPGDELFVLVYASVGCEVWGGFAKTPRLLWSAYSGQTPCDLALVDLDRDGRRDLAIANRDAHAISAMYAAPAGGWSVATTIQVGKFPSAVAFADLEGDARPEVLALDAKEGALSLVARDEQRWIERERIVVGPSPRALAIGDLDGDGDVDAALLVRDASGARLVVLSGDGRGALVRRVPELAVGHGAAALVLVPAADGGPRELWIADPEASEVVGCVVRPRADAPGEHEAIEIARVRVPGGPCALALFDADGDRELEIAVALGGPGERTGVVVLDRGGHGVLELVHFAEDQTVVSIAAGNGARDGQSQLALLCLPRAGVFGGFVDVWSRTDASGQSWRRRTRLSSGLDVQRIVAGDLDRDGRTDWLVTSQFGHRVDLWLARPSATAAQPAYVHQDGIGAGLAPLDVCLGDLDGDGWLDLGTANSAADEISLIFNLGR